MRFKNLVMAFSSLVGFVATHANAADWLLTFSNPTTSVEMDIADYNTNPYVSYFSVPNSDSENWTTVLDTPQNENTVNLLSTVSLSTTGGEIQIFPAFWYDCYYDGFYALDLTFSYGASHTVGSNFSDNNSNGGGWYAYYVNWSYYDPSVSDTWGSGDINFSTITGYSNDFSSLISTAIPEPDSWEMMILGFAGLGTIFRKRKEIMNV